MHPCAKSKQSNKNKVQQTDLANKGNQKLYLPVKNKTNLSTNWKTKLKQGAKWRLKQYVERKGKERKNRYAKLNRGG